MGTEIDIRRAMPEEAAELSRIARAAKASWGYPAEWLSAWESQLTVSPQYIQEHLVFVATQKSHVAGFYALERRPDYWQLEHLWVGPASQRRGVGRSLFEHALGQVRGVRAGRVVIESDPHAAEFYRRMGAHQAGTIAAPVQGDSTRRLPVFEVQPGENHLDRSGEHHGRIA